MSYHVLIPVPGLGVLRMTEEALRAALADGAAFIASTTGSAPSSPAPAADERWLTAAECETATGVPKSWFAEGARRGTIPCKRAGHYVRFRLSELDAVLAQRPRDARIRNERVTSVKAAPNHRVATLRPSRVARNVAPARENGVSSDAGVTT